MRMTAVRNAGHSTKAANKKSQHVKRLLGKLHGKGHESGKRADDTSDESSGAYKKSFESESSGYGVRIFKLFSLCYQMSHPGEVCNCTHY